jgi:hypothetical protein
MTATAPAPETTPVDSAPDSNVGFIDSIDSFFESPAPVEAPPEEAPTAQPVEEPPSKESTDQTSNLDDLDVEVKDWTPEAARRFKELKSELKVFKTRSQELESLAEQRAERLKELEAVASSTEAEELKARLESYEQDMLLNKLERSPAYKSLVLDPINHLVSEADAISEKYSIGGDALIDAIANPDEAAQDEMLSELLADASDRDKARVYRIIEEMKPIIAQRDALRANVSDALREAEELDNVREQARLRDRLEARTTAAKAVSEKIVAKLPFLSSLEGVDMTSIMKAASEIEPSTLDPVTGTYHAMSAKLLPKVAAAYVGLQREIESLVDRLAEYDKASPKAGGGNQSSPQSPISGSKGFLEAINEAFGS